MAMSSRELRESDGGGADQTSNEIQIALVIARMIETVKTDSELMRQAVYDLARYKLQEQLVDSDPIEIRHAKCALETAICGVEEFSRQQVDLPAPSSVPQLSSALPRDPLPGEAGPARSEWNVRSIRAAIGADRHSLWTVMTRIASVLLVVAAVLTAVLQRERLMMLGQSLRGHGGQVAPKKAAATPTSTTADTALKRPPPPPAFPRPTDYGVYALADNALTELQLLPGRAPDVRVAVSAAFQLPGRVSLPNGRPQFIVFRRDAATNILERAEVRVIARIAREFSTEAAGKRLEDSNAWVIRNFSYPYRASPVPDNPEMYKLHSEDPTLQLPPGHYALILKNQSYYFSVEGDIADSRQCIERVVTANGTFYSACKKP